MTSLLRFLLHKSETEDLAPTHGQGWKHLWHSEEGPGTVADRWEVGYENQKINPRVTKFIFEEFNPMFFFKS